MSDIPRLDPAVAFLLDRRKQLGVSQNKLSVMAGIGLSSIKDWETGKAQPTLFNLRCCLQALGYSLKVIEGIDK